MLELAGTAEERVRLIDFGIARFQEAEAAGTTTTTQFAGTTPYMAPEQLRGKPSPASDIYALAVVAYEMLAGQRPFPGAGPIEIYEQQRAGASLKPLLERGVPRTRRARSSSNWPSASKTAAPRRSKPEKRLRMRCCDPRSQLWSRRHTMAAIGTGAVAALSGGAWWWLEGRPLSDAERVIELPLPV